MQVLLLTPPERLQREAFFRSSHPVLIAAFKAGEYTAIPVTIGDQFAGEAAAEEVFDLTNHPGRQEEREQCYGRGRSASMGDIVWVNGEVFLCDAAGWRKI